MILSLPPDIQKLIEERVQSGAYRTPEDVVVAALVNLDQRERSASTRGDLNLLYPDSLRRIEEGVADADAGRLTDGDEFFAELEREESISDPEGRKTA